MKVTARRYFVHESVSYAPGDEVHNMSDADVLYYAGLGRMATVRIEEEEEKKTAGEKTARSTKKAK